MSVNSKMTAIADAIRNLIDISGTMGLDAMASNISSITKRGAVAGTISEKSEQYIIPSGYHNGSGTVEISPDEQSKIIAENIKNGVTILGVAGSASGEIYSVIAVTYPEGSVCTCTNGTKTLTAKDTSGKALFNVSVGEWTVSCTDGSSTASKAVSITAEGQSESVTLTYIYYLQQGSTIVVQPETTDVTMEIIGDTVKYNGTVREEIKIVDFGIVNLTGFSKIVFDVLDGFTYASPLPGFCVSAQKLSDFPSQNVTRFDGVNQGSTSFKVSAREYYFDLSSMSGEYYVSMFWKGFGNKHAYIQTNNIWIE